MPYPIVTPSCQSPERELADLATTLFVAAMRSEGLRVGNADDIKRMSLHAISAARSLTESLAEANVVKGPGAFTGPPAGPPAMPDPSSAEQLSPKDEADEAECKASNEGESTELGSIEELTRQRDLADQQRAASLKRADAMAAERDEISAKRDELLPKYSDLADKYSDLATELIEAREQRAAAVRRADSITVERDEANADAEKLRLDYIETVRVLDLWKGRAEDANEGAAELRAQLDRLQRAAPTTTEVESVSHERMASLERRHRRLYLVVEHYAGLDEGGNARAALRADAEAMAVESMPTGNPSAATPSEIQGALDTINGFIAQANERRATDAGSIASEGGQA